MIGRHLSVVGATLAVVFGYGGLLPAYAALPSGTPKTALSTPRATPVPLPQHYVDDESLMFSSEAVQTAEDHLGALERETGRFVYVHAVDDVRLSLDKDARADLSRLPKGSIDIYVVQSVRAEDTVGNVGGLSTVDSQFMAAMQRGNPDAALSAAVSAVTIVLQKSPKIGVVPAVVTHPNRISSTPVNVSSQSTGFSVLPWLLATLVLLLSVGGYVYVTRFRNRVKTFAPIEIPTFESPEEVFDIENSVPNISTMVIDSPAKADSVNTPTLPDVDMEDDSFDILQPTTVVDPKPVEQSVSKWNLESLPLPVFDDSEDIVEMEAISHHDVPEDIPHEPIVDVIDEHDETSSEVALETKSQIESPSVQSVELEPTVAGEDLHAFSQFDSSFEDDSETVNQTLPSLRAEDVVDHSSSDPKKDDRDTADSESPVSFVDKTDSVSLSHDASHVNIEPVSEHTDEAVPLVLSDDSDIDFDSQSSYDHSATSTHDDAVFDEATTHPSSFSDSRVVDADADASGEALGSDAALYSVDDRNVKNLSTDESTIIDGDESARGRGSVHESNLLVNEDVSSKSLKTHEAELPDVDLADSHAVAITDVQQPRVFQPIGESTSSDSYGEDVPASRALSEWIDEQSTVHESHDESVGSIPEAKILEKSSEHEQASLMPADHGVVVDLEESKSSVDVAEFTDFESGSSTWDAGLPVRVAPSRPSNDDDDLLPGVNRDMLVERGLQNSEDQFKSS